VDPLVPKIFRHGLAADLANREARQFALGQFEAARVGRKEDHSAWRHQLDEPAEQLGVVALDVPNVIGLLAVGEGRGIDHGQVVEQARRMEFQKAQRIVAHKAMLAAE